MEVAYGAVRAGSGSATHGSGWTRFASLGAGAAGSGWTRCARTAAIGAAAAAMLVSGTTLATRATAAASAGTPTRVIVRGQAGCGAAVAAAITQLGGRVTRSLGILDGASGTVPSSALNALRATPCVAGVTPDGAVSLSDLGGYDPTADTGSLFNTSQMIGAQAYWNAGYTGNGVGVAVIDSGVSPVAGLNNGQLINGPDISFDSQAQNLQGLDGYGHGTHMASIIAGNDGTLPASQYVGNTSQFTGVAPDAHILSVKVADAHGASDVSQVIAGIDWVVQHRNDLGMNVRVINLSFGTNTIQSYLSDPLAYAAEVAWRSGMVVVAAAGNGGQNTQTLTDPAIDPYIIAVGAADTQGSSSYSSHTVASFSQKGSYLRRPDVVAPGVHIEGLRDPHSALDNQFGDTAQVGDRFFLGSGTSQATAVVSGAAALILQQYPNATPDQVKGLLRGTATSLPGQSSYLQGKGEINLNSALTAPVSNSTQTTSRGNGIGSLDAARGTYHMIANGVSLTGEKDIFGNAWNPITSANKAANRTSWNGGTFNGAGWSGAGWSGAGWSGAGWSGAGWSGAGWSGAGWSGAGWSGAGWSSNYWSGAGWSGAGWSGADWSGAGWSGAGWSGAGWSGAGWSGAGWSGAGWSGAGWSGAAWA